MSGFHRMITYLYLYEQGTKSRNIGFAKIERRDQRCLLEVHMKNTGCSLSPVPIFLYVPKNAQLAGILLGNFTLARGSGDFKTVIDAENLKDSGYKLDDVKGIYIPLTAQMMSVSQWDDDEFDVTNFIELSENETKGSDTSNHSPAETTSSENNPPAAQKSAEEDASSLQAAENSPSQDKGGGIDGTPADTEPSHDAESEVIIEKVSAPQTTDEDSVPKNDQTISAKNSDNNTNDGNTGNSGNNGNSIKNANSGNSVDSANGRNSSNSANNRSSAISSNNRNSAISSNNTNSAISSNNTNSAISSNNRNATNSSNAWNTAAPLSQQGEVSASRQDKDIPKHKPADALKALEALPRSAEQAVGFRTISGRNSQASGMDQMPGHSQADEPENWDLRWRFILENYPVMTPFAGDEDTLCVRMELKDLRQLPKQFWYLGNNSFLLHGFFNYRYFILGMTEEFSVKKWFIGVPGVFQNPERVMAALFGFPEFRSEKPSPINTGEFGYWYRYLNELSEPSKK